MLHLAESIHDFENETNERLNEETKILRNLGNKVSFIQRILRANAVKMVFDTKLRKLHKSVDTVVQIFAQLMNQPLSPEMINLIPNSPTEFDEYIQKIEKAGYESVAVTFRHLYKIPTSYLIEKPETNSFIINAFVHIPVAQKGTLFKVYIYIPSIMPFSSKMKHGLEVSQGVQGDTIAINEEGKQFVTFDHTKLLQCKQVASFQICSNFDSTWSLDTIDQTCLGVIFKLKINLISKNCPIAPVKLENQVRKMSENTWLLFSPSAEKVMQL